MKIPTNCFRYSSPIGNVQMGDPVDNKGQILSNDFLPSMRLRSIRACINKGQLNGLTFMLGALDQDVNWFELETLGYRYGSNCKEVRLPTHSYVNYMEISYDPDTLQILSAFFNFEKLKEGFEGEENQNEEGDIIRALLGERGSEDGT